MGVANHRSIAWACAQQFLLNQIQTKEVWDVIVTYQSERFQSNAHKLISSTPSSSDSTDHNSAGRLLGALKCNVQTDVPSLFRGQELMDLLQDRPIHTIVHSIAHAPNLQNPLLKTSLQDYLEAHHISAFSFLETAQYAQPLLHNSSSLIGLTYIGAVRAMPNYHVMGPAKGSLEALIRGLAVEFGHSSGTRVNAVSAGPLPTLSAKGGISDFTTLQQQVHQRAPLGNVTQQQVASTVQFLASDASSGITGQTLYVDGGYSIT